MDTEPPQEPGCGWFVEHTDFSFQPSWAWAAFHSSSWPTMSPVSSLLSSADSVCLLGAFVHKRPCGHVFLMLMEQNRWVRWLFQDQLFGELSNCIPKQLHYQRFPLSVCPSCPALSQPVMHTTLWVLFVGFFFKWRFKLYLHSYPFSFLRPNLSF